MTAIAPANEALPQLSIVTDADAMAKVFAQVLSPYHVEDCLVLHMRYKPGKSCLISYNVGVARSRYSSIERQTFSARVYPPGSSLTRFAKAQCTSLATPECGDPVFHLPDLDTIVWAFPNDRKLSGLPALVDRERIAREVIPAFQPRQSFYPDSIQELSLAVVQYVPEHGCTVRVMAELSHGQRLVVYGKAYPDDGGAGTYRNMCSLWLGDARRSGRLHMAEPLAYESRHRILWQVAIEGSTLSTYESTDAGFLSLLKDTGSVIGALHSSLLSTGPAADPGRILVRLREAETRIKKSAPGHASRVSGLAEKLLNAVPDVTPGPPSTLHGDLHWKNVLITKSGPALIDFDNLGKGDPLQDLGSFVASTCARGVVHQLPKEFSARMANAVISGYKQDLNGSIPSAGLRWHIAAALLSEQIDRTLVRFKVRRLASLDSLLSLAEDVFSGVDLQDAI